MFRLKIQAKIKKTFLFVWYFAYLFVPLTSSKVLRHGNKIQKKCFFICISHNLFVPLQPILCVCVCAYT